MKNIILLLINILLVVSTVVSQNKAIGSWTDHFSYNTGSTLTTDGKKIFCGTNAGYFIFNTEDNSLETRSKIDGLSEVKIQKIAYLPYNNKLLVVYENGNIDLIYKNQIKTLPFIKESNQVSGKTANDIYIENENAYIAFDFGIVVLNTENNEIKETFNIVGGGSGKTINAVTIKNQIVYAATNAGVYTGNLADNLLDFNNWSLLNDYNTKTSKTIFKFQNEVYTVIEKSSTNEDKVYKIEGNGQFSEVSRLPKHTFSAAEVVDNKLIYISNDTNYIFEDNFTVSAIFAGEENSRVLEVTLVDGNIFRVDNYSPLKRWDQTGNMTKYIRPMGPASNNQFNMAAAHGEIWTVNGGYDFSMNNSFNYISINRYTNGSWINYDNYNSPSLNSVYDAVSVYLNPNEKGHAYISTWGMGLFEFNKNLPFKNYNTTNSPLVDRKSNANWLGVSSSKIDEDGNLWMVNTHVPNSLVVKKANGDWQSFNFSPDIDHETRMTDIALTKNGKVWVALDKKNEILVFDYNSTIDNKSDDRYIFLSPEKGKGNIPGIRGITFSLDKIGQMWVGTSSGLVVSYSPDRVFEQKYRDLEEILIDDGENIEVLLKGATINAIAIDGANNKWLGTESSGVYQLSPDGKKELQHFTFKNSPLISNQIISIAIDDQVGEVYFGTAMGIVSYKSSVIKAKKNFSAFKIYPNPVRNTYTGPIGISGLMENSTVKITDISGNLVNEFYSEGGQVTWNGKRMNGEKVSSGVYMVMSSAEDEFGNLETKVGKVLFLK